VASALEAIIAQRLVRKICDHCREPVPADPAKLKKFGPMFEPGKVSTFRGKGCKKCNDTGYSGRAAIYEMLVPNEHMKHTIASGASVVDLTRLATEQGATTLIKDAYDKVKKGITTVDEVLRVLGPQVID
jgi:type II secretory ATPase GspE/PulE/Tfp pilus assembly ATPase PilB-like protein